jgi:hypothetical protein
MFKFKYIDANHVCSMNGASPVRRRRGYCVVRKLNKMLPLHIEEQSEEMKNVRTALDCDHELNSKSNATFISHFCQVRACARVLL